MQLIQNCLETDIKVVEDSDETPERSLVIAVGTSTIDHDGEDLASKGRILLFEVKKSKKRALNKGTKDSPIEIMLKSEKAMALGPVTSLSSLKSEDVYRIVVGAGAEVTVEQWGGGKLTQVGKCQNFYHADDFCVNANDYSFSLCLLSTT